MSGMIQDGCACGGAAKGGTANAPAPSIAAPSASTAATRLSRSSGGCNPSSRRSFIDPRRLFRRLREKPPVGRGLAPLHRPQAAILAQVVGILADLDHRVVFRAERSLPHRPRPRIAPRLLGHRPGPRQCIVDDRHVVVEEVGIGLVEVDPLLDDGLVVVVERKTGAVVNARALEMAGVALAHARLLRPPPPPPP